MATYYIKNGGNDSLDGQSEANAWATISKVNSYWAAHSFAPGDNVLFKRGDTFYGTITIHESGSVGNPITISSYGTGNKPLITGFTTITGWTDEGGGIYSKVITSEGEAQVVTVDGVQYAMGRFPKETYNTFESHNASVSITDNTLGESTDWTGAEVVIRLRAWTLYRSVISDHTSNTLTYSVAGPYEPIDGYGYFIQNDIRCCTELYDWYHDYGTTDKFYMYFGAVDPTTVTVNVSTLNFVIYNSEYNNNFIIIDGLDIQGAIQDAVRLRYNDDYNEVKNCNVAFAGQSGIKSFGSYTVVDNNTVSWCNRNGIYCGYDGVHSSITNNTVSNIFTFPGQCQHEWPTGSGIVMDQSTGGLVEDNNVTNIGYIGIYLTSTTEDGIIRNNYVNTTCYILDDGACIYTQQPGVNRLIEYNICLNSVGAPDGKAGGSTEANGIYLDDYSSNTTVRYNIVGNCDDAGIFIHLGNNNTIEGNTVFNSNGMVFSNWVDGVNNLYNNNITYNKFIAKTSTQNVLRFNSMAYSLDIADYLGDYNCYTRPINETTPFFIYSSTNESLSSWKTRVSPQETNSYNAGRTVSSEDDLHLIYNETNSNKYYYLSTIMYDVEGDSYSNTVVLEPWTGLVLLGSGTVTEINVAISNMFTKQIGIV